MLVRAPVMLAAAMSIALALNARLALVLLVVILLLCFYIFGQAAKYKKDCTTE